MKKLLFSVIYLFIFYSAEAQTNVYHPFPDSNVVWVGTSWYNYPPTDVIYNDYNLYISGDTIIGSNIYHKLYQNGYIWATCPPPGYYYFGQYFGAFRQDSANKKVYFFENGNDTLAYDFNLNIGDTLPVTCLNVLNNNYVQSIDSVLVGSQYHKRFWISDDNSINYASLIEG
ncbi:MAG: hypothetical protein K8R58_15300, partial [Bacteroidales bacterium]|nr:hypothetical protein [Bacteroidales bacterium]